jgi:ribulose-5-phosphate 4-epimerase/fuculose-1-phosphate aldolase
MSQQAIQREAICRLAKSLYDRGLTHGASGNVSVRLSDGQLLVSPTNSCLGALEPSQLTLCHPDGSVVSGDPPTKELLLHLAFYQTRPTQTAAVLHAHSTHAVALSMLPDVDPDNMLPALTPYSVMRLGKVKLLPYLMPGDPAMGDAIRSLEGKRSAVVLANHGPVVAGKNLQAAVWALEELEEAAKLAMLLRGCSPRMLTQTQIQALVERFNVPWD